VELQALMKYYDIDGDGNVSYEEFLRGLRDELTPRRRAIVDKAFAMMDRDNSGQLSIQDLSKYLFSLLQGAASQQWVCNCAV
jgi:Ca2+-binding EF-hand superfamily protein